MAKIELDKYYTSIYIASHCINKTYEIIGKENIVEIIEPSAGNGSFSNQIENCIAYDIEPDSINIIKQDFLQLQLEYKKGRLIIGNPPFGDKNILSNKFFKKSISLCDYIAFILPISQYSNNQKMYEFDLVYSEDLGLKDYSGINLHCCFNIYKRPENGINKKPINYKLKGIEVLQYRRGSKTKLPECFDFGMCTWGDGSCGKIITEQGQYAQEHYVVIKNEEYRDAVLKVCHETDWRNLYPSVSSKKLQTWKIYKHLKEQIPELK